MVDRDESADDGDGENIPIHLHILVNDSRAENEHEWVQSYALIPAQDAWRETEHVTEKEAPEHGDKRYEPGDIQAVFPYKLHIEKYSTELL